ncbi:hypothetical protein IQ268_02475 [Oculatella sp. LEGE 06141]|uniref:hypothetical protein n=1 Tax=Oculatella sp. LEGE 06141 TaxID=1828648 RepID=UPI00187F1D16|nr:hypothetical protein [Oculatella sp. LEGE 06141]MBE9177440.1 hypothetical protein [Oculatella sp. LEGE 06141]
MGRKINRFLLLIASCGIVGVVLGGTASRATINQCLDDDTPSNSCLTQNPVTKTIEGMSGGFIAGAGAAAGATWQLRNKDA